MTCSGTSEIRSRYATTRPASPRLAAEVDLAIVGTAGRSEAFNLLFPHIAGANRNSA